MEHTEKSHSGILTLCAPCLRAEKKRGQVLGFGLTLEFPFSPKPHDLTPADRLPRDFSIDSLKERTAAR